MMPLVLHLPEAKKAGEKVLEHGHFREQSRIGRRGAGEGADAEAQAMQTRHAFELMQQFLGFL